MPLIAGFGMLIHTKSRRTNEIWGRWDGYNKFKTEMVQNEKCTFLRISKLRITIALLTTTFIGVIKKAPLQQLG